MILQGREIAVLINKELEPGCYSYKFDISNFASEVFFYGIKAEGFLQTKKMLLIK